MGCCFERGGEGVGGGGGDFCVRKRSAANRSVMEVDLIILPPHAQQMLQFTYVEHVSLERPWFTLPVSLELAFCERASPLPLPASLLHTHVHAPDSYPLHTPIIQRTHRYWLQKCQRGNHMALVYHKLIIITLLCVCVCVMQMTSHNQINPAEDAFPQTTTPTC